MARSAAIPSQTMAGKDRSPWVSGGQMTAASAMATGAQARTPTTMSIGPPGRYASNTSAAVSVQQATRATPMSRSSNVRTRTVRSLAGAQR